jgi:hypothetical protein
MAGKATPPKPAGWGDDEKNQQSAPTSPMEERVAKLESEHAQLLVVLDRHGINLPS